MKNFIPVILTDVVTLVASTARYIAFGNTPTDGKPHNYGQSPFAGEVSVKAIGARIIGELAAITRAHVAALNQGMVIVRVGGVEKTRFPLALALKAKVTGLDTKTSNDAEVIAVSTEDGLIQLSEPIELGKNEKIDISVEFNNTAAAALPATEMLAFDLHGGQVLD